LQCLIVSMSSYRNAPISFHGEDETTGCVFDFNNEKSSIRGSIIRPNICESHTIAIKKIFGDQFFADFQSAIAERKWWKNIEQSIKVID